MGRCTKNLYWYEIHTLYQSTACISNIFWCKYLTKYQQNTFWPHTVVLIVSICVKLMKMNVRFEGCTVVAKKNAIFWNTPRWMRQVFLKCLYNSMGKWHHITEDQPQSWITLKAYNTYTVWQKHHSTSSNIFLGFGCAVDFFRLFTVAAPCGPPAPLAIVSWFSATMAFDGGCPPVMRKIKSCRYPLCCSSVSTEWNKNIHCLSPRPNMVSRS